MKAVPLPSALFTLNRERLVKKLAPRSVAVLNANDLMPTNADGTMGHLQNADLFYLTGVHQEETILLLAPGRVRSRTTARSCSCASPTNTSPSGKATS